MNREPLPGASNAMAMGIISIITPFLCCGPFGIIFSIIGLISAGKAENLYYDNPELYSGFENVKTAKILSYIGLGISLVCLLALILFFGTIVAIITTGSFDQY
ncbi:CCC motif membrane protein [Sediminicola luteus]|uniref:CCC motif membrane protein n=1 Tax=Sediminicola luteus TaxID=319238 RepID=A0ABV2TRY5_9FLAO